MMARSLVTVLLRRMARSHFAVLFARMAAYGWVLLRLEELEGDDNPLVSQFLTRFQVTLPPLDAEVFVADGCFCILEGTEELEPTTSRRIHQLSGDHDPVPTTLWLA